MQTLVCRSTIARLVKVAAELSNPNGATMRELSERLEVSQKTLFRDRDFLRDRIGLAIECEMILAPDKPGNIEYRHRALNAEEMLPMIELVGRFVI